MKVLITLIFGLFLSFSDNEKEGKYPVSDLSLIHIKNANVVIRDYHLDFKVKSVKSSVSTYRVAYTILNEKGSDYARAYIYYDSHRKVNYLRGFIYDKLGNQVGKLKKSDIEDQSAISGGTIYGDSRVIYTSVAHYEYPFTVEFEYQVENSASLHYPTWRPMRSSNMSLQNASLTISTPANLPVRFMEQNMDEGVTKSELNDEIIYQWTLSDKVPNKTEPMGLPYGKISPTVYTAPSDFTMDNFDGNMESWKNLGLWQNQINQGRDDLPEATVQEIKSITKDLSREEKIKRVYEYLQENTRYVSVQLGIGGWQPFKASFVDEKKYGDCKALTNYTKSLLSAADIDSYYTLVKAGSGEANIRKDFPSRQFNHVILCVPNKNDTIWLECTSQTNPFGYLGKFTGDRDVLVINETGGHLVHTKKYSLEENRQITNAKVKIDDTGNAFVNAYIVYTGVQVENQGTLSRVDASYDKQKKWLYKNLDLSGARINEFNLSLSGDKIPQVTKSIDVDVPKYATTNGKRIFIQPNILSKWGYYPNAVEDRKYDVIIKYSYWDTDTIEYEIPTEYHLEFKPDDLKISSDFGEYSISIILNEGKLLYIRNFKYNAGIYPAESYEVLRDFLKKVVKADKTKIVLVNRT